MDSRLTPQNGRVAAMHLRGKVEAAQFVNGAARQLTVPIADLLHAPDGRRERQVIWGDRVSVYEMRHGWVFVQSEKDGFVGYLPENVLGEVSDPTHWVTAPATHIYPEPNMKSHEIASLGFASRLTATGEVDGFLETPQGFIPHQHVWPIDRLFDDPVEVATLFLGTPYLWGGNSRTGIDCSGLVQAGFLACGLECPGDSDQQETGLGHAVAQGIPPERGDLLFWKGHVALVVGDGRILHANAHHMQVAYEGLEAAVARIKAQGDGPVIAHKRPVTNVKIGRFQNE